MIYVHVPFCRSFCTYCDFYSEVALRCRKAEDALKQDALFGRFADALEAETRAREHEIHKVTAEGAVNTLYIGGGTPSVLPLGVYERLLSALKNAGVDHRFAEFTVEVNPEDIVEKGEKYVEGLLRLGVDRVSMGVQSFDDRILKWMNRRHTAETAVKAYGILESAGVENISIDLIFGLPQLSSSVWSETLDKAMNISSCGRLPRHVSSYQLSVEPGSMLARLVEKGVWSEASDELCQEQYDRLCEVLKAAGYHHYEISNFALPGYEAVHNSAYWRHVPYIGLGPGAHSFLSYASGRDVPAACSRSCRASVNASSVFPADVMTLVRQWNADSLERYMEAGGKGEFTAVQERETLSDEQIRLEKVMLGLRTAEGLPEDMLRECCDAEAVDRALAAGDLVRTSVADVSDSSVMVQTESIRIPESRFFVSDAIIASLI